MKYAIIENGVVKNIAVANSPLFENWIPANGAQIGDSWDGENFSRPAEDTQALAEAKLAAINEGKNAALDGGFTHDGTLYDSDAKARLAYLELSLKLGQDATYSTTWKASTGHWVTMDAALFAALQPSYEAHIQACFAWQAAREQEVVAAVAAMDVEALRAVEERMG
jgi:hypothetical protein